jgi:3-oxoacyl-[acyl-carrier-protein] synthase III
MQVWISGTGRAVPARRVTTGAIERKLGLAPGKLGGSCGVEARFVCQAESQITLAVAACQAALDDAGLSSAKIDTLIAGASVPFQPIPATAPLIMRELAMEDGSAAAFDVNSTCLSFLTGFEVAARQIDAGTVRNALVVSAEVASRGLPWQTDPETAALFGDGAGAAVLSHSDANKNSARVAAVLMRSYPSAYEACGIGAGGTRFDFAGQAQQFAANAQFAMDGKVLFRLASLHFRNFVDDLLDRAGWLRDDVDLVIPHQASPAALAHMIRQTEFKPERVVNIVTDYGNQIAASIPFALDLARRSGRVRPGGKLLMLGTSAGVSFGGIALVA